MGLTYQSAGLEVTREDFVPAHITADYTVSLAGNPNTGKSTVFNALTGLNQHTGNWPGKTVASTLCWPVPQRKKWRGISFVSADLMPL